MRAEKLHSIPGLSRLSSEGLKAFRYHWPISAQTRFFIAFTTRVGIVAALLVSGQNPTAHIEHGPLENFQAVALSLSAIVMAVAGIRLGDVRRVFAFGLALFCFIFFMLEFDTRALDMPTLRRFTNGMIRNVWLGGLAAAYGFALWRRRREMPLQIQRWLGDRAGLLMLLSGGFWIAGAVFEHGRFFSDPDITLMLEEVMEVNAALFMAWSAFASLRFLTVQKLPNT